MKYALLLALALSACGGGGSAPSTTQAIAIAPAIAVRVELFGDSTQPPQVASEVQTLLPNTVAQSFGHKGTQLGQLLSGTTQALGDPVAQGPTWAQVLAASSAQIVVVNHGVNDAWYSAVTPTSTYRSELQEVVRLAQAAGKVIALETPVPLVPGGASAVSFDQLAHMEHVQAMREVAAQMNVPLCDVYDAIVQANKATLADMPDGVHPAPRLYESVIAPTLARCVAPLGHH